MTEATVPTSPIGTRGQRLGIGLAAAACLPGGWFGAAHLLHLPAPEIAPPVAALVFGAAVVGAAFLLAWAAEVAQIDISASLAIAALALIAVMPEYAVSFVFAWQGGNRIEATEGQSCVAGDGANPCQLVLANMTGANRLLIGVGWSMVVFIAWYRHRKRGQRISEASFDAAKAVEVAFLGLATLYSLTLPLKRTVTLLDAVVLVAIFVAYTIRISRAPAEEPELIGPSAWVGSFPQRLRRLTVVAMFAWSAVTILLVAERFAESLVATGEQLGISEFLLVQWLAPLASEAPELLVAGLYAWRLNVNAGLGTLISSKVNQWTLLVGTLPLVFAVASGSLRGLPIHGDEQPEDLFLTAAQSAFAVAVLLSLSITMREALALFSLFWAQFIIAAFVPGTSELTYVGFVYLALAAVMLFRNRHEVVARAREGFREPFHELAANANKK